MRNIYGQSILYFLKNSSSSSFGICSKVRFSLLSVVSLLSLMFSIE